MLSKVLKYDFKRIGKSLLPLYSVTLIMALFNYGFQVLGEKNAIFSIASGLVMFAFILLLMAVVIGTFGLTIRYFWVNLLSDEGYLTNTLPVKKSTLINSKIFVSMFFGLVSIVVLILAAWLGFLNNFNLIDILKSIYSSDIFKLMTGTNNNMVGLLIFSVMMIITYVGQWLFFIFSLALGQTKSGNRVLYSFVYGALLYGLQQLIGFILVGIIMLIDPIFVSSAAPTASSLGLVYGLSIALNALILGLFWYGTIYVFNKKLNLE